MGLMDLQNRKQPYEIMPLRMASVPIHLLKPVLNRAAKGVRSLLRKLAQRPAATAIKGREPSLLGFGQNTKHKISFSSQDEANRAYNSAGGRKALRGSDLSDSDWEAIPLYDGGIAQISLDVNAVNVRYYAPHSSYVKGQIQRNNYPKGKKR